jgi:putative Mg2+ transporter-C (MgtC) family protein
MITWQETILRLVTAVALGGLVGIERQRYDWAAGLRTHMLVCLGSALIMVVSAFGFADILGTPNVNLDPSRIAAQVVSGIGFLGAGTILFLKNEVIKGLTTAAGLWAVAGVGLAVGSGLYLAAIVTTVLILIILIVVKPYKKRLSRATQRNEIELLVSRDSGCLSQIQALAKNSNYTFSQIIIQEIQNSNTDIIQIKFNRLDKSNTLLSILDLFQQLPCVQEARAKF